MSLHLVIFAFLSMGLACGQTLPSNFSCRYGDFVCYQRVSQLMIRQFAVTGMPAFNLRPFDPLRMDVLRVPRNTTSPVSIDMTMTNAEMLGMKDAQVLSVRGLDSGLKENLKMELFMPIIVLRGSYEVNGEIYKIPIVGRGQFQMVLTDTYIQGEAIVAPVKMGDKVYFQTSEVRITKWPQQASFDLTGLYDGNQKLADKMVKFLNANGVQFYTEWGPTLERAKSVFMQQILNEVFSTLPYRQFFLTK